MAVTAATITAEGIIARLASFVTRAEHRGVIAFDADGTLWTGDVSDDVFLHSVDNGLLRGSARPALSQLANEYGVAYSARDTSSEIARALFSAYHAGGVPELDTYAMMAWCYAGFEAAELRDLARLVLSQAGLSERTNRTLARIVDWIRAHDLDAWVVSASPLPILEVAVQSLGFGVGSLIATEPAIEGERVLGQLGAPVPYGEAKVSALRARIGAAELVAAFGDSRFDLQLLSAATFGVAVNPKPDLREALADRSDVAVLV